jgi:hypothetical protein
MVVVWVVDRDIHGEIESYGHGVEVARISRVFNEFKGSDNVVEFDRVNVDVWKSDT